MTRIRPFRATDLVAIELQAQQRGVLGIHEPEMNLAHGFQLERAGPAYSAEDANGVVLACAGLAECFVGKQATAWAMFAEGWWQRLDRKVILRALRAGVEHAPYARIEALARAAMPGECRLLEAAGFRFVAELRQWGPRSETVVLHERLGPVAQAPSAIERRTD